MRVADRDAGSSGSMPSSAVRNAASGSAGAAVSPSARREASSSSA
jgi:hypothetical protein